MSMPPAAKEIGAASTDGAPGVETLAAKRSLEDDPSMASISSNKAGGEKKRKLCGDAIARDPLDKRQRQGGSRSPVEDETGPVEDDTKKNTPEHDFKRWLEEYESSGRGREDMIERDRRDIKEQLSSGSSILVLQTSASQRSHCRASFCIPELLRGHPNIESAYRFNLMDQTGQRQGDMAWYPREYCTISAKLSETLLFLEPNRFYHISCIEHLFDLREVLDQGWMLMEGGVSVVGIRGKGIIIQRFPTIIEEWFEHKGSVFTIDEYEAYQKACEAREGEESSRRSAHLRKVREDEQHKEQCNCALEIPEIKKSDYFPEERTPRLISQVLASLAEVSQIDCLNEKLLIRLKDMNAKEGKELLERLVETKKNREKNASSNRPGRQESDIDIQTTAEAAASPPE